VDAPICACARFLLLGSYADPIVITYAPMFMIEPDLIVSRDCNQADLAESLELICSGR